MLQQSSDAATVSVETLVVPVGNLVEGKGNLASVIMGIGVLQLPYDGLKSFMEVQRMARRAVIGESEDVRLDAFAYEDLGEKPASGLKTPVPRLAVGKYDDSSELCHFDQVLVILWAARVWDDTQELFVGGTVRESVADVDAAVNTPCPRKPATFRHAAIVHRFVRSARVHHDEHGMRLCLIPRSAKLIAVAFIRAAPYYCGAFHVTAYG